MKRILTSLVFTACTFGAIGAHASSVDDAFGLDTTTPSTSQAANGNGGDASVGNNGRSALGGSDTTHTRSDDDIDTLSGSSSAAPRKARVRSWQSLLPGSIQ